MMRSRLITSAAIAAVALALGVQTSASAGTYPGRDGRLAFTRANEIYAINANGSGVKQLTTQAKNYFPKWSPDGKRIAFVHEAAPGIRNLWVMNGDGSGKKQVTTTGTVYGGPTWSPDGKWIAFGGGEHDFIGRLMKVRSTAPYGSPQIIKAKLDSDGPRAWDAMSPAWSANGRYIAFVSDDGDNSPDWYLEVLDITTSKLSVLAMVGGACCGEGYFAAPNWSPNSAKLAYEYQFYVEGPPTPHHIAVITYPGAKSVKLAQKNADGAPAFSPSGASIALVNNSTKPSQIILATATGTNRHTLTAGYQPDWQPLH